MGYVLALAQVVLHSNLAVALLSPTPKSSLETPANTAAVETNNVAAMIKEITTSDYTPLDVKEIVVDTGRIAFPISGNMNITLLDGDYASDYAYKLLPGAQLTVGNGATLTLNNKFVVYKESDIVYSGTNEKYPSGMGDAVLQIGNGGTLIINGAFGGKVTGNGGATVRVGNSAQMSASVTEGTGSKEVSITTVDFIYTVTSTINNTAQLISGDGSVADMQTGVVYKYNGATWVVS